jgi:hypothetical protein
LFLHRYCCISNGTIFFSAGRLLMLFGAATASEARFDRLLGAVLCCWCLLEFASELLRHRWARRINIALPVSIAALMASTVLWLPKVSKDGDRFEAAMYFLLFASAPICLAVFNYLAYRLTRSDAIPEPSASRSSQKTEGFMHNWRTLIEGLIVSIGVIIGSWRIHKRHF